MMNPGLTSAQFEHLKRILVSNHNVKIIVSMTDLNHKSLFNASEMLFDGQVNISSNNDITRSATLSFWDPRHQLGLDGKSLAEGSNFYTRMFKVTYCVWEYGMTRSYDIPLFHGPVNGTSRDGGMLEVTCMGKELLAQSDVWTTARYRGGEKKTEVFRKLMTYRGGETRFDIQPSNSKIGSKGVTYVREQIVWDEAKKMARSLGYHAFYDGRGVCRARVRPSAVSWNFRDGPGGSIVNEPKVKNSDEAVKNVIWVEGATPSGKKKAPSAISVLPSTSAVNHRTLGRIVNGNLLVPRILLQKETVDTITNSTAAKVNADQRRDSYAQQQSNFTVDTLSIPMLEEQDLVGLTLSGKYSERYRVTDMSIPFSGPVASLGSSKNLSLKRRK